MSANSQRRSPLWRTVAAAAVLAALAHQAKSSDSAAHRYQLQVIVQKAEQSALTMPLQVTGLVTAAESSDLAFRVGGTVVDKLVQTGDTVHQGQVLARLGTAELNANITSAEADVASAKASLDLAQSDLDRQKSLLDKGFTTRSAFDQATKQVDMASAGLKIAESQLQIAQENLSYAELKATADGVVTAVNMEVGQVVQAGQVAVSVAAGDRRQAVFDVSEAIIAKADLGKVKIYLAADPTVVADATIAEVSPTVNGPTGTVRIKADLINPPVRMNLGSAVTGEGRSKPVKGVVLPYSALSRFGGKPAIWVVDPASGKVNPVAVDLDSYVGQSMVVSGDGLKDGALVVTKGALFLSPDLSVAYSEENK